MADAPREPELRALDASFERPSAELVAGLAALGPAALGDVLDPSCALRHEIRGLWPGAPRVAGPALTVRTGRHDNLMLHAAIYLAQPGDVLVVEAGCDEAASAGGNVCAIAARRGVRGLVVDGVVRDVAEMQAAGFPVFARGVSPVPGRRVGAGSVASQIRCGGVVVDPGAVIVGDDEGLVVVPRGRAEEVLAKARAKADADAKLDLDAWAARHRAGVDAALRARGLKI